MHRVTGEQRRFRVLAWPSDRRIVLYVPDIEASTVVDDLRQADAAARSLIADLTGIAAGAISCDVSVGRPTGS